MPGNDDLPYNSAGIITPFSFNSPAAAVLAAAAGAAPTSGTVVGTAADGIFIPFILTRTFFLRQFWWYNGATAAGNIDMGVYRVADFVDNADLGLAAPVGQASTGAVAQSGVNSLQFAVVSASAGVLNTIPLQPGKYWMAISFSNAAATLMRTVPTDQVLASIPALEQVTVHPLPATIASFTGLRATCVPVIGIGEGLLLA